jgi:hypothetical protein
MKHNIFKIRKHFNADSVQLGSETNEPIYNDTETFRNSVSFCQEKMTQLMSMFETFMKHSAAAPHGEGTTSAATAHSETERKIRLQY